MSTATTTPAETIKDQAARAGLNYQTVRSRIRQGWNDPFSAPARHRDGRFAVTDYLIDEQFAMEIDGYRWYLRKGYPFRMDMKGRKHERLHHMVLRLAGIDVAEWASRGFQVDHINNDRKDSRLENLRMATPRANRVNNTSDGVYREPNRKGKKWIGRIRLGSGSFFFGSFHTRDEAAAAVKGARQRAIEPLYSTGDLIDVPDILAGKAR